MAISVLGAFGALIADDGVLFRVHAPHAREMHLLLYGGSGAGEHRMTRDNRGVWELLAPGIEAGQRYMYRMDDLPERPDPASRFQPLGVHGPSEVVDPHRFGWTDAAWRGVERGKLVIYELHVGTFTDAGTFRGVTERLPALRELGITAIELMPVADFAGERGWGYDGAALYAPSRAYGHPDDLRSLVDRAHALDLAVFLDVVYNHLGPEGSYLPHFNPQYLSSPHRTPWGSAVNLDGPGSDMVRRFVIDNAVHWVGEYHFDGLRLDATHALIDTGRTHVVREIVTAVRQAARTPIAVHVEDFRNLTDVVRDGEGGWGADAVWADDFHHVVRRMVAGDSHSYYADYEGTCDELARTIRQGWLFTGEPSKYLQCSRGTDPSAVPMHRFVVCVQNHDQVGNRALGDRLHHRVDAATWRAISLLLLTAPMTPLIFMGQEWAASTPFQFFSDLGPPLGAMVSEGRREEFRSFPEFAGAAARSIPDPQSPGTFSASRLRWEEREMRGRHAPVLALYRDLLALRRTECALHASDEAAGEAVVLDSDTIAVRRHSAGGTMWIVVRLRGSGTVELSEAPSARDEPREAWQALRTTEDPAFVEEPAPLRMSMTSGGPQIHFQRPGGVIFRIAPPTA